MKHWLQRECKIFQVNRVFFFKLKWERSLSKSHSMPLKQYRNCGHDINFSPRLWFLIATLSEVPRQPRGRCATGPAGVVASPGPLCTCWLLCIFVHLLPALFYLFCHFPGQESRELSSRFFSIP